MRNLNWTYLKSFLAIAENGTLSSAAKATTTSQPTMGRHIAGLEQDLGVRLFDRTGSGFALTPAGLELLEDARAMARAAERLSRRALGQSEAVAGVIRITASEVVATYILPEILTALRHCEPEIDIELVASNETKNLLQREADIAVRMYRPQQMDVITRKISDMELGIFATPDYLAKHGTPHSFAELRRHEVIGYDADGHIIEGFHALGFKVDRGFFSFRCDDQVVCWQMVLAGYGIGFFPLRIATKVPQVRRIGTEFDLPRLPIWLTAHAELKTSRRVRRVFDFLAAQL